jgi:UDP-glucose 4-epimerase
MHFLLTGGAGFIGTHLSLRLLEAGHRVTVLDNFSTGQPGRLEGTRVRLVPGTVTDRQLVYSLAADCDYIIHLASVVGVRLAMKQGYDMLRTSYIGTENVLEAATANRIGIFAASSSAIYGKTPVVPASEEDDCLLGASTKPSWLYSVGKLVEEHLSLAYHREKGTYVTIGRFFNVIGPFQTGSYGMVVPTFIGKALRGEPLPVYGDGSQTRTFGYVEDILDGLELMIRHGAPGEIYNVGGTEEISISALAEKIIKLTGSSSAISFIPYGDAFGPDFEETNRRIPDISKLGQFGYSPRFTLDKALTAIIAHQKKHT